MTLNEIAYNIKNIVEGGISGEDSNISIRQIKSMVHYHRAQLLMKYTDSGRYLSEKCYSEISGNIPEDGAITAPEVLGFPNNKGIVSISIWPSNDQEDGGRIEIPIQDNANKEFFIESRFTGNSIRAFIRNGIIRFYQGNELFVDIDSIYLIKAILSKPEDGPTGYPMPEELISSLVQQVLSVEFQILLTVGSDITNNSMDDKKGTIKRQPKKASPSATSNKRAQRTR
jgi:hypothetical protein